MVVKHLMETFWQPLFKSKQGNVADPDYAVCMISSIKILRIGCSKQHVIPLDGMFEGKNWWQQSARWTYPINTKQISFSEKMANCSQVYFLFLFLDAVQHLYYRFVQTTLITKEF